MAKAPENKNSISTSVFGLQDLVRDLRKQLPILQKSPEQPPTEFNELHAFGRVNLDRFRQDFSQHINNIRSLCSQFETEVLGDVMKLGPGADPAFRKHFTHLKEQAALESTVMRIKESLRHTQDYLETALSEEKLTPKVEIKRLEKVAESMGAHTNKSITRLVPFVDSSQELEPGVPLTTITLGGKVIVVDIDMDDSGQVLRTKVTYVSDALQHDHDERIDRMLAQNLQSRDFELFQRNLGTLALLDRLNVKYAPVDFFLIVKGLLADMKLVFNQETLLLSEDVAGVLMEGHGIPNLYLDYPGITLSYWIQKEILENTNWEEVRQQLEQDQNPPSLSEAAKLQISFEESLELQTFLPSSRKSYLLGFDETEDSIKDEYGEHFKVVKETVSPKFMQPLRFVKALPTLPESTALPMRFVANLDPPVPACESIIRKLMIITDYTKENAVSESSAHHKYEAMPNGEQRTFAGLSLEELLVLDVDPKAQEGNTMFGPNNSWIVSDGSMCDQVYKLKAAIVPAKLIRRIPFTHPVQLYNIIQCLRQQQMSNTLFQSIFNSSYFKPQEKDLPKVLSLDDILAESQVDDKIRIEVNVADVPQSLHITLSPPPLPTQPLMLISLSIDIPADTPSQPTIRLHPPYSLDSSEDVSWNPQIFDEEEMTRTLQASYHVPSVVKGLWKKIEQHERQYLLGHARSALKRQRVDEESRYQHDKQMKLIDE
ncbi:hypothetical protein EC973_007715 [Apophysomyces ossiformis]|uniref:Mediator of RNA polymerase II transcription subunit 1 n=1 Tax=Apophysomyces ossiformis TaxID=679940 RepID=A0A8H7BSX4_9FUNG|nr:hypothetical protein EC973_007715 [Apophysomyces ossiformis]